MAKRDRRCVVCGGKYQYCPTCSQDRNKPLWMNEFDTESCKDIFQICTDFNVGIKNKSEALTALEKCDLTNEKNFAEYIKIDIAHIREKDEVKKPQSIKL